MTNYTNMTVTELRESLAEHGIPKAVTDALKKKELVKLHKETTVLDEVNLDEDFEVVEEEGFIEDDNRPVDPEAPDYNSPEWHDYVMSKFQPNELIDGNPITAGLRRVVEVVLGEITSTGPKQVFPAQDTNGPGRATVVYEVIIRQYGTGKIKTYADTADVWHGNTDDLFCAHPVATACTRAEGRTLRKALKIRALAAEELAKKDIVGIVQATTADWNPEDTISNQQVTFINNKCKQLDIDVRKFVNMGSAHYESINDVTRNTAQKMLRQLNDYQQKGGIPEQVQGYESDWRK